jgi:hydroxypyruvate isomerase
MNRRTFLASSALSGAAIATASLARQPETVHKTPSEQPALKGRLKQSVCRWCFSNLKLDDLCAAASSIGLRAIELLSEKEWDTPARYGLTCAIGNGPTSISDGFNRPENHDKFITELERMLPLAKAAAIPQLIVFSGNRKGMSDTEGLTNCAAGLKRITPIAEKHGVTIIMELLNSKVDHGDYMCDHTAWGLDLVQKVGSPRFKLLYDIYHMQIMEGDVIRTVTAHLDSIAHFHTAGVPGRHELDDTQELNYGAICDAIVNKGFTGYLAQEFIPTRDPLTSLRQAVRLCDV